MWPTLSAAYNHLCCVTKQEAVGSLMFFCPPPLCTLPLDTQLPEWSPSALLLNWFVLPCSCTQVTNFFFFFPNQDLSCDGSAVKSNCGLPHGLSYKDSVSCYIIFESDSIHPFFEILFCSCSSLHVELALHSLQQCSQIVGCLILH